MRVYIASKYIAHKELNRKIYEELVHAEIPAFFTGKYKYGCN